MNTKRFLAIFLLFLISFIFKVNFVFGECKEPRIVPCELGCNTNCDCSAGLVCQENQCREQSSSSPCALKANNCASYCFQPSLYLPTITLGGASCTCYPDTASASSCATFCNNGADSTNTGAQGRICTCNPTPGTTATSTINNVSNFIFKISIIIAPLMMVIGAFLFTTSGGSVEQIDKAKKLMIAAAVGFIIILLAKAITDMIRSFLGG